MEWKNLLKKEFTPFYGLKKPIKLIKELLLFQ
jgi:hypothetical protein